MKFKSLIIILFISLIFIFSSCAKTEMTADEIYKYLSSHKFDKLKKVEDRFFRNARVDGEHIYFKIINDKDFESFKYLIDNFVDINIVNNKKKLLISYLLENNLDVYYNYLINSRCKINYSMKDINKKNFFDYSIEYLNDENLYNYLNSRKPELISYMQDLKASVYSILYKADKKNIINKLLENGNHYDQNKNINNFLILAIYNNDNEFVNNVINNWEKYNMSNEIFKNFEAGSLFNKYLFDNKLYAFIKGNLENVEFVKILSTNPEYMNLMIEDEDNVFNLSDRVYSTLLGENTKKYRNTDNFRKIDYNYKIYNGGEIDKQSFFKNIDEIDIHDSVVYLSDNFPDLLQEYLYDGFRLINLVYNNNPNKYYNQNNSNEEKYNKIKELISENLSDVQKAILNNFSEIIYGDYKNENIYLNKKELNNVLEIIANYNLNMLTSNNHITYQSDEYISLEKFQILNDILINFTKFLYNLKIDSVDYISQYNELISMITDETHIKYLKSLILCLAIENNKDDVVNKILDDNNFDINKKVSFKSKCIYLPIHFAIQSGNIKLVKRLVELGASVREEPVYFSDFDGYDLTFKTNLFLAYENLKLSKYLVENGCRPKPGPLWFSILERAIIDKKYSFVELYLKHGENPNRYETEDEGAGGVRSLAFIIIELKDLKMLKIFIDNGMNINSTDTYRDYGNGIDENMSVLDVAIKYGNQEIIDYLKLLGAKTLKELENE